MEKIEFEDLSQKVYRALKELILKNELASGDRLLQEELAERFGISRTPLLSAISKLEKEMLVEIVPRKGAFIKRYTPGELVDIYDIRLRLEPLGAREAARNGREEQIQELQGHAQEFKNAVDAMDEGTIRLSDYQLHMKIMEMSGNMILNSIISSFNIVVISNIKGFPRDPHESYDEHMGIIDAISSRDEEEAERMMFNHIGKSREIIASGEFA